MRDDIATPLKFWIYALVFAAVYARVRSRRSRARRIQAFGGTVFNRQTKMNSITCGLRETRRAIGLVAKNCLSSFPKAGALMLEATTRCNFRQVWVGLSRFKRYS